MSAADGPVWDRLHRPIRSLRISVTDRCNLRCRYCMPADEYVWLPRASLLSFEEISRLVAIFGRLGVHKVRLTGGEPLLRQDLPRLVALLAGHPLGDIAMTTNGLLLARSVVALREAGLSRLTVSLDTLRPERFERFAKSNRFADVLRGFDAAAAAGFTGTKLNAVIMRGVNDDEVIDLLDFAMERDLETRFIEYMDVGGAIGWRADQVVSRETLLNIVAERIGRPVPISEPGNESAPADRFRLPDGRVFGIIASTTAPFCRACDRCRITADGMLFLCLYADRGIDLREPLRAGASDGDLAALIRAAWEGRADRGAEERSAMPDRQPLYQISGLRENPHREMHTRGG